MYSQPTLLGPSLQSRILGIGIVVFVLTMDELDFVFLHAGIHSRYSIVATSELTVYWRGPAILNGIRATSRSPLSREKTKTRLNPPSFLSQQVMR